MSEVRVFVKDGAFKVLVDDPDVQVVVYDLDNGDAGPSDDNAGFQEVE